MVFESVPNEAWWLLLTLMSFVGVLVFYRLFGKIGLFIWTAIAVILANIQVMKTIEIFGFVTAMGNIIYGSLFLVSDILNENHGRKDAQRMIIAGFAVLITVTVIMQLTLQFIPHESDTLSPALEQIFGLLPRIAIASITAYIISQSFNAWLFDRIKRNTKGRMLWLRNNISTMLSQTLDNVIFTLIAFVGFFGLFGWGQVFPWEVIWSIFLTSIAMKVVVAVLDTPFLYFSKKITTKEE